MAAVARRAEPDLCRGGVARWPVRRLRARQPDFRLSPPLSTTRRPTNGPAMAQIRPQLQTGRGASLGCAVVGVQSRRRPVVLRRLSRSQNLAPGENTAEIQTPLRRAQRD